MVLRRMVYTVATFIHLLSIYGILLAEESPIRFSINEDGFVTLPAEVFHQSFGMMIDTGADLSIFDISFREQLGSPVKQVNTLSVAEKGTAELFKAPTVTFKTTPAVSFVVDRPVLCVDLAKMRISTGSDSLAVLGMDYLKDHVLRLNFDKGFGEIRSRASLKSEHVEKIFLQNGKPRITLRLPIEGFTGFCIDTGGLSTSLMIEERLFKMLLSRNRIGEVTISKQVALNNLARMRTGILESIEIGPHRFNNVVVIEGAVNGISLPMLRRFDVEFDFPNRKASFVPGLKINEPDPVNICGLMIRRQSGAIIADVDNRESIAARAGIETDDEISTLNGTPIAEISARKSQELRSKPESELKVGFKHGAVFKEVTLKLPHRIDPFPAKSPHELIENEVDPDWAK